MPEVIKCVTVVSIQKLRTHNVLEAVFVQPDICINALNVITNKMSLRQIDISIANI